MPRPLVYCSRFYLTPLVLLIMLRELQLPATQRDRSQIIIETLRTGSLDELCDQSREEVCTPADPGDGLR